MKFMLVVGEENQQQGDLQEYTDHIIKTVVGVSDLADTDGTNGADGSEGPVDQLHEGVRMQGWVSQWRM